MMGSKPYNTARFLVVFLCTQVNKNLMNWYISWNSARNMVCKMESFFHHDIYFQQIFCWQHTHPVSNMIIIEMSFEADSERNPSNDLELLLNFLFFKANFVNLHRSNHILGYYSTRSLHPQTAYNRSECVFLSLLGWMNKTD